MIDEKSGFWYYDIHNLDKDPLETGARVGFYWDQEPKDSQNNTRALTDEKKDEKGYAIQARDVIMLDAPKVYLSPNTPLNTMAQDLAGAINELGGCTEDSLFPIQTYSTNYVSGKYEITEGPIVRIKWFKGPFYSGYYAKNSSTGSSYNIDYDYVSESWATYDDASDPNKQTGSTTRTIYLRIYDRDTPNERCDSMYFSKWGLYNNSNWFSQVSDFVDRTMNVYGFG